MHDYALIVCRYVAPKKSFIKISYCMSKKLLLKFVLNFQSKLIDTIKKFYNMISHNLHGLSSSQKVTSYFTFVKNHGKKLSKQKQEKIKETIKFLCIMKPY